VREGKIVRGAKKNDAENNYNNCPNVEEPRLYYYSIKDNAARELSLEETAQYHLSSRTISPDGFEVVTGHGDSFFPFGYSGYRRKYIKKGAYSKKLNIETAQYYSFRVLAWVKE